jgi:hypothetical protein
MINAKQAMKTGKGIRSNSKIQWVGAAAENMFGVGSMTGCAPICRLLRAVIPS